MNFTKPINKLKEIKSNLPDIGGILNDGKNSLLDNFKELEQDVEADFANDLTMTEYEQAACEKIIESHIDKCGIVGDIPVPGTGVVADLAVMVTMTFAMSKVFGISLNKEIAQKIAMQAINTVGASYVIKKLIKEAIKIIPLVGKVAADYINSRISNIILNKIGWDIAKMLSMKKCGMEVSL
ncbi:MAG: hypothetical protein IKN43_07115 [Selenomonadaceae bacterium]|nr:hypothetical protein [Selenomonadaceae bacterium]